MLHTVLLTFRSFHGTDEENLFNILKRPFSLNNHVLLFVEPLCLIDLSDVLTL